MLADLHPFDLHVYLMLNTLVMNTEKNKTKLTLTVRKDIIEKVKQQAKENGISVSKLFEVTFIKEQDKKALERKKAITKLRKMLECSKPVQALSESDRTLYHRHLDEKYG